MIYQNGQKKLGKFYDSIRCSCCHAISRVLFCGPFALHQLFIENLNTFSTKWLGYNPHRFILPKKKH